MTRTVEITELNYYPVKSCHGIAVESAWLDKTGLRDDRRWMIVQPDGMFITQREAPQMALLRPSVTGSHLRIEAPGMPDFMAALVQDGQARRAVRIWNDDCLAQDWGDEAATWLGEFMGSECRLVSMAEGFIRPVTREFSHPGARVGFADGFPLLLTSESSLEELNRRLAAPIPMNRFRPNIVCKGGEPFEEDDWAVLSLPAQGITMRVVKPCARCVITTTDQEAGVRTGDEPLAALTTFRLQRPGGVMFGQNLVHDWPGKPVLLHVGDKMEIVERKGE